MFTAHLHIKPKHDVRSYFGRIGVFMAWTLENGARSSHQGIWRRRASQLAEDIEGTSQRLKDRIAKVIQAHRVTPAIQAAINKVGARLAATANDCALPTSRVPLPAAHFGYAPLAPIRFEGPLRASDPSNDNAARDNETPTASLGHPNGEDPQPLDATNEDAKTSKEAAETQDAPLRVLVVDDNPINRKVMEALLSGRNAVLTLAENGAQAVELFQLNRPDLVLMDIRMPVMNGVEATLSIRDWERASGHAPVPIIAVTANVLEEQVQDYLEAGMDDCIPKPVQATALLKVITDLSNAKNEPTAQSRRA